jgi:hypothetical protein
MNHRTIRNLVRLAMVLTVGAMTGLMLADSGPALEGDVLSVLPRLLALGSVWLAGIWVWMASKNQADFAGDEVRMAKYHDTIGTLAYLTITLGAAGLILGFWLPLPDLSSGGASLIYGYAVFVLKSAVSAVACVLVVMMWKGIFKPVKAGDTVAPAADLRIPSRAELSEKMREASDADLQALTELAQWMARHEELLMTGRRSGILIGLTREVADFVSLSFHSDKGKQLAANVLILPEVVILDPTKVSPFPAQA